MTTLSVKDEIDSVIEKLKIKVPGYRERKAQKVMFSEVAKTFWNAKVHDEKEVNPFHNIIAIEAPTGTGKSQGYAIPSILVAKRKQQKVVISSATVKLQQQICEVDLPLLNDCIEGGITFMLVKGRTRYVCPLKLEKEAGQAAQSSLMAESNGGESDANDTQIIQFQKTFQSGQWNGDRDLVKTDDSVWSQISTNSSGCLGSKCSKQKICPFFQARAKMDKVDVIVANHDLLLADLSLGGGVILPEPENTVYVIDEGHHLPEKTLTAFAANFAVHSTLKVLEKLSTEHARSLSGSLTHTISNKAEDLFNYLTDFAMSLEHIDSLKANGDLLRFKHGVLPESFNTIGSSIKTLSGELCEKLSEYVEEINKSIETDGTNAKLEKELTETNLYYDRVINIFKTWRLWLTDCSKANAPVAKWIEVLGSSSKDNDFLISASPVSAAQELKTAFWDKALGVVITSATLTALGKFDLFLEQSGLSLIPERVKSISLPSPFDFQTQGTLVMPKMKFGPKDVIGHTQEVIQMMPGIYPEKGGMLVLFTSRKQMNEVRDAMPESIKEITMVQGDKSLTDILNEHRTKINNGQKSVIWGLQSLAEGVDLPHELCVRVVIVKLPFDVPSDPIAECYAEWLESNGKNPFYEVSLPAVSRKLLQWSGRLIRTMEDYGQIYCLDNRLSVSKYGQQLVNALPPYKIEKNVVLN